MKQSNGRIFFSQTVKQASPLKRISAHSETRVTLTAIASFLTIPLLGSQNQTGRKGVHNLWHGFTQVKHFVKLWPRWLPRKHLADVSHTHYNNNSWVSPPTPSLRICILKGFCSSLEHIVRIHSVDGSVLQDAGLSHTDSANSDVFIFWRASVLRRTLQFSHASAVAPAAPAADRETSTMQTHAFHLKVLFTRIQLWRHLFHPFEHRANAQHKHKKVLQFQLQTTDYFSDFFPIQKVE